MHPEISEVQDGFILRWIQESLNIITKNSIMWIFLIVLLCISSLLPINLFFKSFIGLWLMLAGLELCIASDLDRLTFKSFINIFIKASEGFLLQIHFKIIFFTMMFGVYSLATLYNNNIKVNDWLTDIYWIYALGFLGLTGVGFQVFTHLYSRFFDSVNKRTVNFKCKLASKINYKVEIVIEIFIIINIILISFVFPLACIMLFPISCGFIYVGFKEIFLIENKDRLKALLEKDVKTFKLG